MTKAADSAFCWERVKILDRIIKLELWKIAEDSGAKH